MNPKFLIASLFAALPVASTALAAGLNDPNWPVDPAQPLVIANRSGQETQAKIVPRADGGFYLSWFDDTDDGFDVRLQRLDGDGNEMWPHNGILVSDRSYSSTTDYGLSIDSAGNALLAFQCCSATSNESVLVYRIDETGASLWGANGVTVTTASEDVLISSVTGTSDGNVVAAWMNGSAQLRAQKLDAGGAPLWGTSGITLPGPASGLKFLADIKPGLNGDAIVAWSNQAGSTRILRAQKFASADGAVLWGTDGVRVSESGNLQAGYFPKILVDGAGGAVFAYYDIVGASATTRVQHLDADGVRLFGDDGVLATTEPVNMHVNPAAQFDPVTGTTNVLWIDTLVITGGVQLNGLYAQRIDATGTRQFGDSGLEIVPMTVATDGAQALSQTVVLPAPAGFLAAWVTGNTSVVEQPISVVRIAENGDLPWNQPKLLKPGTTTSSRLVGATSTLGYAAFAWCDSPTGDSETLDILARNLQYNGEFGDILFRDGFDG
jgi:hypothetical protein